MPSLPELHYCHCCGVDLGPDNGDGICAVCDQAEVDEADARADEEREEHV